jgi:cold shock protein
MSLHNKVDVSAEIGACERIWELDEVHLDLELRKMGVDPESLPQRLEALLKSIPQAAVRAVGSTKSELESAGSEDGRRIAFGGRAQRLAALAAAIGACAAAQDTYELAGVVKFFNSSKNYGFFTADDGQGDVLIHLSCLEAAGYHTAYEGARIHAVVHKTCKGLQALRIVSMDDSTAVHPSQIPQRTREKINAESEWVRATVRFYDRLKGYGFISEGPSAPDCFVHADTLRRWGMAVLHSGQMTEIRWGMSSKGRMVAEIRHPDSASRLPPLH